jgi:integrase
VTGRGPRTARDDAVAAAIARYRPRSVDEEVACFARAVVARAAPANSERAKALLWATTRLGAFGVSVGLALDPQVLFHPSVIERFIVVEAQTMSSPVKRTVRTNLRHVALRVAPALQPRSAPLARERSKSPYTESEIAAYLRLADAQPTVARARRVSGLICLGAGAGLVGKDLRHVRGSDVYSRSGGVLVEVKGARPRVVPVLSRFHERVLEAASFASDGYVIGGKNPERRNVTTPLVASVAGGTDLPALDTGRLRATWLKTVACHLGLKTFMAAAGITCSQRLGDIVATLEVQDEKDAVALLGGTR